MVNLSPNPHIGTLCVNKNCDKIESCARFQTHWLHPQAIAIFKPKNNGKCAHFLNIPANQA